MSDLIPTQKGDGAKAPIWGGGSAPQLRPEVVQFINKQYEDWTAGRRIACWFARGFMALGGIAGAAYAMLSLWSQLHAGR